MNLTMLFGVWLAVFATWITVSILRWSAGRKEDDHIHVFDGDLTTVAIQSSTAHKLDVLDRYKSVLLIVSIVYGLILGALHMYNVWQYGSSSHLG